MFHQHTFKFLHSPTYRNYSPTYFFSPTYFTNITTVLNPIVATCMYDRLKKLAEFTLISSLHFKWMWYWRSLLSKMLVTFFAELQLFSFPASQWWDLVDFFRHLTNFGQHLLKHRFHRHQLDLYLIELPLEYRILQVVSDHLLNLDYQMLLISLLDIHGRMNPFLLFEVKINHSDYGRGKNKWIVWEIVSNWQLIAKIVISSKEASACYNQLTARDMDWINSNFKSLLVKCHWKTLCH